MLGAARLLDDFARSRRLGGLRSELLQLPGRTPVLLVEVEGRAGRSPSGHSDAGPLLIYGHFDKQPPLGDWREGLDPYLPVREGDRFYGRGTADDGYSLFAALGALQIALGSGLSHRRAIILIEASEESGSPDLGAYLDEIGPRLGPNGPGLVVCLDSGSPTVDRLWLTTSLRGIVSATLRVSVLRAAVHSGAAGGVVPDSFRVLRQLLERIEDGSDGTVQLDSCSVEVPAKRRAEAETASGVLPEGYAARFPTMPGLRLARGAAEATAQLLVGTWSSSLAVVGADGFPPTSEAGSVIRPFSAVKIVLRIPPTAEARAVAAEIEERILAEPPEGASVELLDVVAENGFDAPEAAPWLAAALDEASAESFGEPAGRVGEGGSIPFLGALKARYPAAQFAVTGVLDPDSNAHGPDESLHIPTAKHLTASLARLLSRAP